METIFCFENVVHSQIQISLKKKLNWHLEWGQLMRIEGVNGSGKTTALKLIAGLINPEEGTIHVTAPIAYVSAKVGLKMGSRVGDYLSLYDFNLTHYQKKIPYLFDALQGLSPYLYLDELSSGQQMALRLSCAFARQNFLLVLDEPIRFLDYTAQKTFWLLLQWYGQNRGSAVLTVHSHFDSLEDKQSIRIKI